MSLPGSSPLPIPTFQDTDGASPKELLSFLQDYITRLKKDSTQELLHDKRAKSLSLLDSLDGEFLQPFPLPHQYSWHTLHEKIKLSEVIFDMLYRMTRRCGEVLCLHESLAKSIFVKLLDLATSLDVWIDERDIPLRDGYASPATLYTNCVQAAFGMLQAFEEGVKIDHAGKPGWQILRSVGEECFAVCQELLSTTQTSPFYIHLFSIPRICPGSPPSPPAEKEARDQEPVEIRTKRTFVYINDSSQIPSLLTLLLELQLNTLGVPALGQTFTKSLVSRTAELSRQIHDFFVSPACVTSDVRRARAISRLVVAVTTGFQSLPPFAALADPMRLHLLVRRLSDGPSDVWDSCDRLLLPAFSSPFTHSILRADARSIFMLLKEEQWEDTGSDLRALASMYLQAALPGLDEATIQELSAFLKENEVHESYRKLLQALEKNTPETAAQFAESQLLKTQIADVPSEWRRDVKDVVQSIIEPDDLDWMEDEEDLDDVQFVERALADIESRFERPIYNPSAKGRVALARQLTRLSCALAQHLDSPCPIPRPALPLNPMRTCIILVECLLEGDDKEVTPAVRKAAFVALARSVRHQTVRYDSTGLRHVAQLAVRAMKDLDRNVRLSAGRCLTELVHLHLHFDDHLSEHLNAIFVALQNLLTKNEDRCKETALITVGQIAKLAAPPILRKAIFCFIMLVGHPSPLIRGVAYMQIQATAKHHKKSVYNLLSPDMDTIAPYLVGRIKSHPQGLIDLCALISTPAPSFITVTLSHTLPPLFANRERDNLEAVSREIGMRLHEMFLNHASKILAQVFMLSKPGNTTAALNFIVGILAEASSGSRDELDAQHVVRGQIVEVIGDIVLRLGDPDDGVVASAKNALIKVQQVAENRHSQYRTHEEALQALLQQHMLGIVSQINDYLQEVHGKQNADSKRRIIKSLGVFIKEVGPAIQSIAPQIMATMQTSLVIQELSEATLEAWNIFLRALKAEDLNPHVGPTTATFVIAWPTFTPRARDLASQCFEYLILRKNSAEAEYMDDVADCSSIPKLKPLWRRVKHMREGWQPDDTLRKLLDRIGSDNTAVISRALEELKAFLLEDDERFIRSLTYGDIFDPLVGNVMTVLFTAASRDLEGSDTIQQLALECIGTVGAIDPDRFKFGVNETTMIVKYNFRDESESVSFAIHLIKDVLVGAFRSTCDIAYQNFLAYAIQELLRFCRFNPSLVTPGSFGSLPLKVRSRWKELPRAVKETVAPLLAGRFAFKSQPAVPLEHPIYPRQASYREWIQAWTACLLHRTSGPDAQTIFSAFHPVVRNKDVGVAHHLLPHLVLNILLSDEEQHIQDIRTEILTVLEDQVDPHSTSTVDKKELSAQAIFMLMDHLNRWVRTLRQEATTKQRKKTTSNSEQGPEEYQLLKVDSILTSIDQSLMAKAALQCKAYARALMCFEQQLVAMQDRGVTADVKVATYETMHEIYAQLDEPDGMEGISTLILTPSLDHQIREHESTGRWTSAQSCWEVRLQHSPSDLKSHLGLLRCLRNLGHYDTMRTHVDGLLIRNQAWESDLLEYQVESDCIVGNWGEVEKVVERTQRGASSVLLARVLLAMRSGDTDAVESALFNARKVLGSPISAAGAREYRRSYEAVLDLHILHELQIISQEARSSTDDMSLDARLDSLQRRLAIRLDSTLPSFRSREPLLSMRRTALGLQVPHRHEFKEVIGRSWLLSARLARKAGYWQTAYSAVLQARQNDAPFLFIQSAKLSKATGEPLKALQEVDNSLKEIEALGLDVASGEIKAEEAKVVKAKVTTLRARWLGELDRHDQQTVFNEFQRGAEQLPEWESGWFHYGRFHDECATALNSLQPSDEKTSRRLKMNLSTIRSFGQACRYGSKHIYQALSRFLTLWMNVADDDVKAYATEEYRKISVEVSRAMKHIPMFKWYTAFPQVISRVGHPHPEIYSLLSKLIRAVTQAYPNQALWQLISVIKSNQTSRRKRGQDILHKLKAQTQSADLPHLIEASLNLSDALLGLCNNPIPGGDKQKNVSMSRAFPKLYKMLPLPLLIPLQESLRAVLPSTSSAESHHQPFPANAPTFHKFEDDIEIMRSLARPRKLTIMGSDGKTYIFLGKPKDDLRKDARLMDFNAIINKQLKSNSESRRRQLYIRTYGVVTLNEECGFIQWVPDTSPMRVQIQKYYSARGIQLYDARCQGVFDKLAMMREKDAAELFKKEVLAYYPPVMHEWFVETFPEPAAWLSSRIAYTRTAAVMSMVGFILGLGDRHCENVLMDTRSGDIVHVDFNCLFEKGKKLQTPERVPFRMTQNVVDGFGVTGVEGVFRIACEITMQALRDNKECLMTVLDAFIHDPLVEWQDEKREMERSVRRKGNQVQDATDLVALATSALLPIQKKLQGIYNLSREKELEKEIPISSMVQVLITEATDLKNLSKMYIGWNPYF